MSCEGTPNERPNNARHAIGSPHQTAVLRTLIWQYQNGNDGVRAGKQSRRTYSTNGTTQNERQRVWCGT